MYSWPPIYIENVELAGTFGSGFSKPSITISNGPSWMVFDEANSRIVMSPTSEHFGVYEDINITATNANGNRVTLGNFDIQVIHQ